MAYRVYNVQIQKEDQDKAENILNKHWLKGDIDAITVDERKGKDGIAVIHYWISPYICEDLGIIINEFKQEGIRVM